MAEVVEACRETNKFTYLTYDLYITHQLMTQNTCIWIWLHMYTYKYLRLYMISNRNLQQPQINEQWHQHVLSIAASRHLQMAKIGTLGLNISSSIESGKEVWRRGKIGTLRRQCEFLHLRRSMSKLRGFENGWSLLSLDLQSTLISNGMCML